MQGPWGRRETGHLGGLRRGPLCSVHIEQKQRGHPGKLQVGPQLSTGPVSAHTLAFISAHISIIPTAVDHSLPFLSAFLAMALSWCSRWNSKHTFSLFTCWASQGSISAPFSYTIDMTQMSSSTVKTSLPSVSWWHLNPHTQFDFLHWIQKLYICIFSSLMHGIPVCLLNTCKSVCSNLNSSMPCQAFSCLCFSF